MSSRGYRRRVALTAVAVALGAAGAGAAAGFHRAAASEQLVCNAVGTVQTSLGANDQVTWSLSGTGSCLGVAQASFGVVFSGTGTSTGLGLCTGDLSVTNLALNVTATLTNSSNGSVSTVAEQWTAPLATYPETTAFVVGNASGQAIGLGDLFTRIFGKCAPGGSPSTTFAWTQ